MTAKLLKTLPLFSFAFWMNLATNDLQQKLLALPSCSGIERNSICFLCGALINSKLCAKLFQLFAILNLRPVDLQSAETLSQESFVFDVENVESFVLDVENVMKHQGKLVLLLLCGRLAAGGQVQSCRCYPESDCVSSGCNGGGYPGKPVCTNSLECASICFSGGSCGVFPAGDGTLLAVCYTSATPRTISCPVGYTCG